MTTEEFHFIMWTAFWVVFGFSLLVPLYVSTMTTKAVLKRDAKLRREDQLWDLFYYPLFFWGLVGVVIDFLLNPFVSAIILRTHPRGLTISSTIQRIIDGQRSGPYNRSVQFAKQLNKFDDHIKLNR